MADAAVANNNADRKRGVERAEELRQAGRENFKESAEEAKNISSLTLTYFNYLRPLLDEIPSNEVAEFAKDLALDEARETRQNLTNQDRKEIATRFMQEKLAELGVEGGTTEGSESTIPGVSSQLASVAQKTGVDVRKLVKAQQYLKSGKVISAVKEAGPEAIYGLIAVTLSPAAAAAAKKAVRAFELLLKNKKAVGLAALGGGIAVALVFIIFMQYIVGVTTIVRYYTNNKQELVELIRENYDEVITSEACQQTFLSLAGTVVELGSDGVKSIVESATDTTGSVLGKLAEAGGLASASTVEQKFDILEDRFNELLDFNNPVTFTPALATRCISEALVGPACLRLPANERAKCQPLVDVLGSKNFHEVLS